MLSFVISSDRVFFELARNSNGKKKKKIVRFVYKTQKPSKLLLGSVIHHQVRATLEPISSRGGSGEAVDAHLLKIVDNKRKKNLTLRGTQGQPTIIIKRKNWHCVALAALGKMQENTEQDEKKKKIRLSKDSSMDGIDNNLLFNRD